MIGSYVAFMALAGLAMMGIHSLPILMTVAFVATICVTSAYGYSIERVAYRPLRNSNRLIPLISAIGMSIFLQNTVLLSQDSKDKSIPNLSSIVVLVEIAGKKLLLTGDADVVNPMSVAQAMADKIKGAVLSSIDRCGHWATVEHPRECNQKLTEFLRRADRST